MCLTTRLLLPSCAALLLATSAHATSYTVTASIDGLQEVPPVVTPGTGSLTGTYDDVTNFLTWSGSWIPSRRRPAEIAAAPESRIASRVEPKADVASTPATSRRR